LCFYIRQDYEKVKDFTQEDIAKLQAVQIIEYCASFYKNKVQQNLQRSTALKNLGIMLSKPPYFFTKDDITKFVDSKGIPLLGQYTEQDLSDYLHSETTTLENNNLPNLLVFKVEAGQRYFILKNKVIPLIVRLCSEARGRIRENITKEWYNLLRDFETLPCMKEQKAFNKKLEEKVHDLEPILYALLNSNFLSVIHYETRNSQEPVSEKINLFSNGKLIPYSDILVLSRQEIYNDAKIKLPFWYAIPLVSWLLSLFLKKPTPKKHTEEKNVKSTAEENSENESKKKSSSSKSEIMNAIQQVEQQLIPENSSLEQELSNYEFQWNKQITKQSREQLTEDVNSLIRDYIRSTARTLKSSKFNIQRIENLANTLVKTPSLQNIREKQHLTKYIQLYILKLVKNM
jgi:flagellar biosynthesis GTPase FlhF